VCQRLREEVVPAMTLDDLVLIVGKKPG